MGFSCGIVGLPNVGKSTLFNAITKGKNAEASNYPFCTIEPNKGIAIVEDKRLNFLQTISNSKKVIPTAIEITDIAGLVQGASKGEGLGNKFLSHIKEVDAIIQVVRLFKSPNIIREKSINPTQDLSIINTELILSDLFQIEKREENINKQLKRKVEKELVIEKELIQKLKSTLLEEKMLASLTLKDNELNFVKSLNLLTIKPMMIVVNIDENQIKTFKNDPLFQELEKYCQANQWNITEICIKIEEEIQAFKQSNIYSRILRNDGN